MLPTFFCRLLSAGYLKCTHMHAHTKSLPSGQAIFKKMYTFAGIFFRWFYVYTCIRSFFSLPVLPAFFRSRHTHKNTPLPLSPSSAIYFLHLFFFVNPNDRQRWQLRKILHKTKQEEKSCKRKSNKHPLQFHQDKEQRGNRRTKENRKKYKNKRICRNKKNVFVNRGFPRTSIKNKRKIKKSKG